MKSTHSTRSTPSTRSKASTPTASRCATWSISPPPTSSRIRRPAISI
ncbi:MAG: hypothetical protein MZU97_10115 [Bacillus subtilis]|nr:hypothetical protein [Bacillus subtilis]